MGLGIDFYECKVGCLIRAYHASLVCGIVIEKHLQFVGTVDHVVIRHDISVVRDYDARTETALHRLAVALLLTWLLLARLLNGS